MNLNWTMLADIPEEIQESDASSLDTQEIQEARTTSEATSAKIETNIAILQEDPESLLARIVRSQMKIDSTEEAATSLNTQEDQVCNNHEAT